jgi:NADH:ubiquinone oxidoreductase subunit F (NADH-binding)
MGTPLREVIEALGGGPHPDRTFVAAMSGVANPLVPEALFDTPVSHEAMRAIGSGVGAGGFIVFDDTTDLVAVAAGVARFLAVESCGQCAACKQDGLLISGALTRLARSVARPDDLDTLDERLASVADGARCNLASQQQAVVGSIFDLFPDAVEAHARQTTPGREPELVAPIVDVEDGVATLDERQGKKQPDWTYDEVYSGKWPADRLDDHREHLEL